MSSSRLKTILISVSLAVVVLAVFWRVGGHEFIYYDDGSYVFDNSYVQKGWSLEGLKWAFTTTYHLHWHPLTWLSLMTDSQLFGIRPEAFHLVNLAIHVLTTLLVFYVLTRMTGSLYCSAFVAALFGLHPLHVEPVAWVADRKDLLNAFFWMTTLWLYLRYVRKPRPGNAALVFASFLCSLMAKSMSVTLPAILLVMDYWPLKRFGGQGPETISVAAKSKTKQASKSTDDRGKQRDKRQSTDSQASNADRALAPASIRGLLMEKVLLFLPMVIGAAVTLIIIQRHRGPSLHPSKVLPSLNTLACAIVAYAKYLYQAVWPARLAIAYPLMRTFPLREVLVSFCVLLAISLLAYWRRRQNPYLLAGWLWYLIALIPAIGLVQSGPHIPADRYTYIPLIGIFIMIAWGCSDLVAGLRHRRWVLGAGATICILACIAVSWAQVGRWKDTITIFRYTLQNTENNFVAHTNLGLKLLQLGDTDEAISHFLEAIRINPRDKIAHFNLGNAYRLKKDLPKAIAHFQEALSIDPKYVDASFCLGNVYLQMNQWDLCEKYFLATIANDEGHYRAHYNLASAYSKMGKSTEAIAHLRESIKIKPDQPWAYYNLGLEYFKLYDLEEAELDFKKTLQFEPDYEPAYNKLGLLMMKRQNYAEAIRCFSAALQLNPGDEEARQSLEEAQRRK